MSPKLTIDLSNVEDFSAIPEGVYSAYVVDVEVGTSSAGNTMATLTLNISEGEYENRKLFTHMVFTERSMWRVKQILEAILGREIEKTNEFELDTEELIGKKVKIRVSQREYQGVMRNNVDAVYREDFTLTSTPVV